MREASTADSVFAWIGKVITVIAALAGIVAVVLEISPKGPKVVAVVTAVEYGVPVYYFELLEDARRSVNPKKLEDWFVANGMTLESEQIRDLNRSLLPKRMQEHVWEGTYRSLWFIKVSNRGNEPAGEVVLDTPLVGHVRTDAGAGRQLEQELKGSVELGDLRPQTSVDVWIWAGRSPTLRAVESMSISHSEGVGELHYTVTSWSWSKWWAMNHQTVLWTVGVLVGIATLASLAMRRKRSRRNPHDESASAASGKPT